MIYSITDSKATHSLTFSPSLTPQSLAFTTGMIVQVSAPFNILTNTILITSLNQINVQQIQSSKDFVDSSGIHQMTSIGILLRYDPSCPGAKSRNAPPPISTVQRFWTNDCGGNSYSPALITLQSFFSSCSYGKTAFTSSYNALIGPVFLPCNGTASTGKWVGSPSSTCSSNDFYGWASYVDSYAASQGYNLGLYSRRVLLLPGVDTCGWSGLANVGCGGSCHAWINDMSNGQITPDTFLHELGHTIGLQHAHTPFGEYGDNSSPMGSMIGVRCYNAPQSWQLGWSLPIATLTASSLPIGTKLNFSIPPLTTSDTNFIRILPSSWGPAPGQTKTADPVFISYREPTGTDFGLSSSYAYVLSIHSFAGQAGVVGTAGSYLQALISSGSNWTSYGLGASNLLVKFISKVGGGALVSICRFDVSPLQCAFNQTVITSNSPPPPRSPPPPPPPPPRRSLPPPPPPPPPRPPPPLRKIKPSPPPSPRPPPLVYELRNTSSYDSLSDVVIEIPRQG